MNISVGELIEMLKIEEPNKEIPFGGIDFYRIKNRGDVVQIEFNQTVFKNDEDDIVILNN